VKHGNERANKAIAVLKRTRPMLAYVIMPKQMLTIIPDIHNGVIIIVYYFFLLLLFYHQDTSFLFKNQIQKRPRGGLNL